MTIYYCVFILAFLMCIFDFVHEKTLYTFVYILFCIFLISLVAFRHVGIDNDSQNYQNMFITYSYSSFNEIIRGGYGYVEKGYVLLNKIIASLGGDFRILMVVMAVLTGIFNYCFFYKNSIYPFISLLIYLSFFYFYRDFTQIRYALSCALVFWSIKYYLDKKLKYFFIFFIFAISFHNSAFILLLAIPFIHFVKNKLLYLLLPLPSFLIGLTYNPLTFLLIKTVQDDNHLSIYINEEGGGSLSISILGYFLILIHYLLTKRNSDIVKNNYSDFYYKIIGLGVSLNLLFIQSAIFQRFSFLLFQFFALFAPIVIKEIQTLTKNKEISLLFYYSISFFMLFYGIRMIDPNLIRPYMTF